MEVVVLIDTGPVAYQIAGIARSKENPIEVARELIRVYHANGGLIHRPGERIYPIWVRDVKHPDFGYWRHRVLAEAGIPYKPGRVPCPDATLVKDLVLEEIPPGRVAGVEGFEADDLIANLTQQYRDRYRVDIVTCDTDLLQLVGGSVRWVNTMRWEPILRGEAECLEYFARRFPEYPIKSPREVVDLKVALGDRSDGLPPGTDRGIIDLIHPLIPCRYRWSKRLKFQEPDPSTWVRHSAPHCPILEYPLEV